MGLVWSTVIRMWYGPHKVVMVGLDAAGKTTLLYYLKLGEHTTTIPTIGFNVERISIGSTECMVWDVGGQEKIRQLWSHYMEGTHLLIYVVDSHDTTRMSEAASELQRMLREPCLSNAVLLILANKQDLPQAMSCAELTDSLFPEAKPQRVWRVQSCCAVTGDGVDAGLRWGMEQIHKQSLPWLASMIE